MKQIHASLKKNQETFLKKLRKIREQKGKEQKLLTFINRAILSGHTYVINLYWEEALLYQHIYMSENAKENPNKKILKNALKDMESSIEEAEFYIKKYDLNVWKSRLFRFKGRVCDYKKDFKKSIGYYEKAIKHVGSDEEYKQGYPRQMELEAFLSYAILMDEDFEKGIEMSKKIYEKFFKSKDGKNLKKKDYSTWAIWATGIPIRTLSAKINAKRKINYEDKKWLNEAQRLLDPPRNIKVWTDFRFRKEEIESLLKLL